MKQAKSQEILDLSREEIIDVSKLPTGTPIKIGDNVVWFDSVANHVTTFNKLIAILKQYPGYPCVIFSPEFEKYPEYTNMISNYICKKTFPDVTQTPTFKRLVTEETLTDFSQHCKLVNTSELTEFLLVDKRKAILTQLNALEVELHELTIKRANNTLTQEECDRGDDLYVNLIPELKKQFEQATMELADFITNRTESHKVANKIESDDSITVSESPTVHNSDKAEVTETVGTITMPDLVSETVLPKTATPADDKWALLGLTPQTPYNDSCRDVAVNWRNSHLFFMPWSIAVQMANSSAYAQYKFQQTDCNGYVAVPLEYLLVYNIQLYADGLPIVFTSNGEFMRIGNSEHDSTDEDYWYPKPYNLIKK